MAKASKRINKNPEFTEDQIAYWQDWLLNRFMVHYIDCKCFKKCCLVLSMESEIKAKLKEMMKKAKKK